MQSTFMVLLQQSYLPVSILDPTRPKLFRWFYSKNTDSGDWKLNPNIFNYLKGNGESSTLTFSRLITAIRPTGTTVCISHLHVKGWMHSVFIGGVSVGATHHSKWCLRSWQKPGLAVHVCALFALSHPRLLGGMQYLPMDLILILAFGIMFY